MDCSSDIDDKLVLGSLGSGTVAKFGLVVLTDRTITSNDIFAKLVESGRNITSVDETLADLEAFVEQVSAMALGSVFELKVSNGTSRGFELKRVNLKLGPSNSIVLP